LKDLRRKKIIGRREIEKERKEDGGYKNV